MKAAFLIRCSTQNQELGRQIRDLTTLAKSFGYEYDLENLVYGEKITGKDDINKKNRDSIDKLFKGAKEHKFDVVLVSEASRMSRDPVAGRVYVTQLVNLGVPVYFKDIKEWSFEPNTVPDETKIRNKIVAIGGAFDAAWKYLNSMKTQIASARRNYLDKGAISVGKPFFGYKWFGGKDKNTKTKWVVDEVAAEAVEAIFIEYLKEGSTLKSTALAITDKFGEKLNKRFTVGTIEHILSFESYHTGIKKINLRDPDLNIVEEFDVEIPVLISEDLYEKAKAKRIKNRNISEYPTQTTRILSKLFKCPCCGYTMTPRAKAADGREKAANGCYRIINGKKALSWMCMSGVNKYTDCTNRMNVANEKAEPVIWELIKKELVYFASLNSSDREEKIKEIESQIENYNYSIDNYNKEIEKLDKKASKAFQIALSVADDDSIGKEAMDQYKLTLKAINKDKKDYQTSIEQALNKIESLTNLKAQYENPSISEELIEQAENDDIKKRNLVKELITKIVPYKITTFKVKERYGEGFKTLKNGVVLLEVYTINGIYYVLYNTNERGNNRYAYYMTGVYANFQNGINKFPAYKEGEYFVISNANMVMETEEIDEVVSVNDFKEIAENNNWVLEYPYIAGN